MPQFWMSFELENPKESISNTFSPNQINGFLISTRALSGIIAFAITVCLIKNRFVTKKVTDESVVLLERGGEIS